MQRLLDQYRRMDPVNHFISTLKEMNASWYSLDSQRRIVNEIIRDPIAEKYAPETKYRIRLIKQFIREIERKNYDISDELAQELIYVLKYPCGVDIDDDELYHVSYRLAENDTRSKIISFRVSNSFRDVGMKIWEAGFFMAEFARHRPHLFTSRKILELGSGVGLTGIMIAACCAPKSIILTDYTRQSLVNLRYNVQINDHMLRNSQIRVEDLDWNDCSLDHAAKMNVELLISCDCVYDVSVFPALVNTVTSFFNCPDTSESPRAQRVAYFAATLRNQATFSAFLSELDGTSILLSDITDDAQNSPQVFDYPNRNTIRMFCMSLAQ